MEEVAVNRWKCKIERMNENERGSQDVSLDCLQKKTPMA